METDLKQPETIDEYIAGFPDEVQEKLRRLRQVIKEAAPEAVEAIKYRMPTFVLHGNLVHFAAYKHHVGFYPTPHPIEAFRDELAPYKVSKGAIQFPIDQPLPLDLISRMVKARVEEAARKTESGRGRKQY